MNTLLMLHIAGAVLTATIILRGSLTNQKLQSAQHLVYATVFQLGSGFALAFTSGSIIHFCANSIAYLTVVLAAHIALRRASERTLATR